MFFWYALLPELNAKPIKVQEEEEEEYKKNNNKPKGRLWWWRSRLVYV